MEKDLKPIAGLVSKPELKPELKPDDIIIMDEESEQEEDIN